MPRIRSLHPSFWTDDKVAQLPYSGRLLFQGLWTYADDEGRLKDNPRQLKAQVFPYDSITAEEIAFLLQQMTDLGVLIRYNINGNSYLHITHFKLYQKPERPSKSKLPAPEYSESIHRILNDNSVSEQQPFDDGKGKGEGKGKGKGKGKGEGGGDAKRASPPSDSLETPEDFVSGVEGLGETTNLPPLAKTALDQKFNEATESERQSLKTLKGIAGWPFDFKKDLEYLRQLAVEFSAVDIAVELPGFAAYQLDHPLPCNKGSPRLRLRNWMQKAQQFTRERKQDDRTREAPRSAETHKRDAWDGWNVIKSRSRDSPGVEEDTS